MDDGNRVSADAPFWWTSLPQLHTFTLSSADALWLKGVREGALAVARTPWSDAAGRRTAQLGESQNYFVTMGTQNPDITCTRCAGGEVIALSSRRLATSIMAAMINQPSGVARSDRVAWPRRFARPFARLWRPRDSQRIGQQTNHQWWVAAALPFEPQPLPYSGG